MNENATLHLTHGATAVQTRLGSAASAATRWLNSRNQLLSGIVEEQVTNRQMLHIAHCFVAFMAMAGMASTHLIGFMLCTGWFAASLFLASRKGGLR